MTSTSAFHLHTTLSTNARKYLTIAISLDEQNKPSEALAAYERAATTLTSYLQLFSSSSSAFAKLAPSERAVVSNTVAALTKHKESTESRQKVLAQAKSPASSSPLGQLQRRVSAPPALRHPQPPPTRRTSLQSQKPAPKVASSDPLRQAIESEILDCSAPVGWDDVYGLEDVKRALNEMVILPAQRPDLYTGLRAPGKGVLLFGPPGTGKTLIAKAVATNANATFFSISASSLNSKFHGESERLVRALFQVARERQPSFIFIDEVDSILGSRSDNEHEASRRLKTEFMAQFDGAMGGSPDDKVYVMAASNRPYDLDDAVRRRLDRRIYVPLPDEAGRQEFFKRVTEKHASVRWSLSDEEYDDLAKRTTNFSGSDVKALCREASLMPLRELGTRVSNVEASDVRACSMDDFNEALRIVRPSSNRKQIAELEKWNKEFGSRSNTSKRPDSPGEKGTGPGRPKSQSEVPEAKSDENASRGTGTGRRCPRSLSANPDKWNPFQKGSRGRR